MPASQLTLSQSELRDEIISWLEQHLEEEPLKWIIEKADNLDEVAEDWEFFSSFSAVPRYTGKKTLKLTADQEQHADQMRAGWKPGYWTIDELGRTLLVLSIANREEDAFLETLGKTHQSSDMREAESLYKALPVLPYPDRLQERAAEGIRSNMTSVFNAVALWNPYPADYFDEGAWNQLVLKALFVESPLYKIQGLERRRNENLAKMLVDYAHERWAADRSVSPELWRPVGPFADETIIEDIQKVLQHPDEIQQQAAVLALSESSTGKARQLLTGHSDLKKKMDDQRISWNDIGRKFEEKNKQL